MPRPANPFGPLPGRPGAAPSLKSASQSDIDDEDIIDAEVIEDDDEPYFMKGLKSGDKPSPYDSHDRPGRKKFDDDDEDDDSKDAFHYEDLDDTP